jgi:hypothetical protein
VTISADDAPTRASDASLNEVEFTSEAASLLPRAARAADAAVAKRDAMEEPGVPVRSVPFATASAMAAARDAARTSSAAVLAARGLLDAALVAASIEPTGSAAYTEVATVDEKFISAVKITRPDIETRAEPSGAIVTN